MLCPYAYRAIWAFDDNWIEVFFFRDIIIKLLLLFFGSLRIHLILWHATAFTLRWLFAAIVFTLVFARFFWGSDADAVRLLCVADRRRGPRWRPWAAPCLLRSHDLNLLDELSVLWVEQGLYALVQLCGDLGLPLGHHIPTSARLLLWNMTWDRSSYLAQV